MFDKSTSHTGYRRYLMINFSDLSHRVYQIEDNYPYFSVAIDIHLADHIVQLLRCWLLTQRVHHHPQLLGRNGPIPVLVKQSESLLELCCLLVSEMFSHLKTDIIGSFQE